MNRNSEVSGVGTFEDLTVYQAAREFRKTTYQIAKILPDSEEFGLAPQIRRAALSLTNNISEGHGRYHYLEQIKFMFQARGSLQELVDDLNTCEDESYVPVGRAGMLKQEGWRVRQLIDGYISYLRKQKAAELKLRENAPGHDDLGSESTNYGSTNYDSP